ncbi:MAG: hypothetical protein IJ600_04070 [Lachnospiraceae bacterium]|nr:hypothetical protein [Lachnospiraceae bacterium]
MTTMEILLLVGGLAAFVISFFLPEGKKETPSQGLSREDVQQFFDDEIETSRQRLDNMTEETLSYSMEKTERSLEKIANEKILAVGEYSDTVLDQINQSHNQVVFLSDMLNRSKEELTDLLNRADQASKDANDRANAAYDLASNAKQLAEDAAQKAEEAGRTAVSAEEKMIDARRLMQQEAGTAVEDQEIRTEEREISVPGAFMEEAFPAGQQYEENTVSVNDFAKGFSDVLPEIKDAAAGYGTDMLPEGSHGELADTRQEAAGQVRGTSAEAGAGGALTEEELMEQMLRQATAELAQEVTELSGEGAQKPEHVLATEEDMEALLDSIRNDMPAPALEPRVAVTEQDAPAGTAPAENRPKETGTSAAKKGTKQRTAPKKKAQETAALSFKPGEENTKSTNERILEMHRMGRSDVAIARDLGMGVGEVKLVIALDEIS